MRIAESKLRSFIKSLILESIGPEPWNSGDGFTYYPSELWGLLSFRKEVFSGQKPDYIQAGMPESVANNPIVIENESFRLGSKIHHPSKIFKLIIGWHPPEGFGTKNNPETNNAHEIIIDGPYTSFRRVGLGKSNKLRSKTHDMGLIDYILSKLTGPSLNYTAFTYYGADLKFLHYEKRNKTSNDEKQGVFWDVWCCYDRTSVERGGSPDLYNVEFIWSRLSRIFTIEIKNLIIHELGADLEDAGRILIPRVDVK